MNSIPLGAARRILPQAAPDGALAAVMLAFLATAGLFYVNIMPALVDGLVRGLGFSPTQAGNVASANVYGAALGALAAAFVVHRLAWKPVSAGLLVALIAIDLVSMRLATPEALLACRAVDGLVGGFLVGTGFSVIARCRDPDRVFGVLMLVQFGAGGLALMVLPQIVNSWGTAALFVTLILMSAATLAMLPFLAPYPQPAAAASVQGAAAGRATPLALPLTLAAIFLFQAANMGLAAYIIELGEAAGLERGLIAPMLGIATWIGMIGSGLVVVMSRRFGRFRPLALGLVATAVGLAAFAWSDLGVVYAAANAVTSITWSLVIPYLFGLSAALGRTGRTATLASFCSKAGLATGPLVAGHLAQDGNYDRLIWISVVAVILATAAALPASRAADRM